MRSRTPAASGIAVHRSLVPILLILGVAGLFQWLFADARARLFVSAVAATGDAKGRLILLTQGQSMDGFGAWSPDGEEIAFMRDGQILVTDPTGKRVRVLTSQPEQWDAAPAWRPDGKALAFVRTAMDGERAQVMVLDLESKQLREVAKERGAIGYVAWRPDGRSLVYNTQSQILGVDLTTGRTERLFVAPADWELMAGGVAVTRDGTGLIFGGGPKAEGRVEYDLWLLPLTGRPGAGGRPQRLTSQGGIMPAPDPSGRLLAYRNPRQETGIYLMNLATRASERLVPDEPKAMYFHPSFSPDGRRMVLSRLVLAPPPSGGRTGFISHLYLFALEGSGADR